MSFVGDFIGDVVGGITGAKQAGKAAERAGEIQAAAAQAGIEEQRRQFDKLVELMAPYVAVGMPAIGRLAPYEQAGAQAFGQQQALLGMQGPEAERAAIERITGGGTFQEMVRQGEESILQQASATGGLRGGNVQAALAQFRPQILNALVEQQYERLGGLAGAGLGVTSKLAGIGQASAAGQAAAGMQSASDVANLLANRGAALAGGQIAQGQVIGQSWNAVPGLVKTVASFF